MKYYLLVLCFCVINLSFTQKCNNILYGEVRDFHNNTAIENATIKVLNSKDYAISNKKGKFVLKNLCIGNIEIEIAHIGCESKVVSIEIKENTSKTIYLEHHLENLDEVVVAANSKTDNTSIEKSVKQGDIDNFTDKSLGDVLNTISGVSSLNTGNTIVKPMIHGLHSSRLLIINNNVRMFDQEWGDEHAPNIDINSSNKIDVIKGANTLKYGSDAVGGLILIRPKKYGIKDSLFGSSTMSLNSNGRGGNISSEIIKTYNSGFYAKIQGSYKQFGDFKAPDYYLTNSGVRNINTSARIGYNSFEKGFDAFYSIVKNELAILESSHIGNVTDLVNAINSEVPRVIRDFSYDIGTPRQTILHHLGKVEAYKRFKGLGKLTVQYDFQINRRKEFDLRRGDLSDTPVIDLRLFTNSLQSNLKIDAFDNLKIDTGVLIRYQQNNAISTGVSPLIPDYEKFDAGIYAIGNYSLNLFTEINAGIRYDFSKIEAEKRYRVTDWNETYNYDELFPEFETNTIESSRILTFPEFTFHCISANLGLSKHFNNDLSLLLNYGLATRVPNPSELFSDGLHHSNARIEYGFLGMNKETANNFIGALEYKHQRFGFSLSPYYKHINGYIQLIPTDITTTIRGSFLEWQYEQVDAQIFGVDLDINKKINNAFSYKGNLSLLRGNNLTDDVPLIHMPSTNFTNSISYYNKSLNDLSISLNHKTVLQQKRYPDYNFETFNAILDDYQYVDISSTPPAYSLLSLNSSIMFNAFKKGTLKLAFNIENILNTSYREPLNRLRYYADELGRNFNLKIKINY